MTGLKLALLMFASTIVLACGGGEPESAPASGDTSGTTYEGVGTVVEIRDDSIVLDHDTIPGFMEAMTMPYPVSDPSILEPFEQGMVVNFRVVVDAQEYTIDRIESGGEREEPR